MTARILPLVLVLSSLVAAEAPATPTKWLVLTAVDARFRAPFLTDAVFQRYLLDPESPPPEAGFKVAAKNGKLAAWALAEQNEKGEFVGAPGRIAYAFASVESDSDQIVMCELRGGSRFYVNGVPYAGDVYRLNRSAFPIAMRKGANRVFVAGMRGGRFNLRFAPAKGPVYVETRGLIRDDVIGGGDRPRFARLRVWNTTTGPLDIAGEPVPSRASTVVDVPMAVDAAETNKIAYEISVRAPGAAAPTPVTGSIDIKPKKNARHYRRTYVSAIDGTRQEYSIVPPADDATGSGGPKGLVLSLHGAGVHCPSQANSYGPKPDLWIVAATNRGRFGFDWQDWGRLDAYEALGDALTVTGADPSRLYLTGHSIGGHGTWHLAANDPDRFAAIAPSAGWVSFHTYAGERETGKWTNLWHAADGSSNTLGLIDNLKQLPIYIIHGEKDDNVPADQARKLIAALKKAGADPKSHFAPGKGHWWGGNRGQGADCVDWPPAFDMFRRTRVSKSSAEIEWVGADPGIDSKHFWAGVQQPLVYGEPFEVRGRLRGENNVPSATTKNVRVLTLDLSGPVEIDGQRIEEHLGRFQRDEGTWRTAEIRSGEKSPDRCGPFKRAFNNRFVMVYGTKGNETENRVLYERARYDLHVWSYRGRGCAPLLSDTEYLARRDSNFTGRNVILYGNQDTNGAWSDVLPKSCPVTAKRGKLTLRGKEFVGDDIGATFVQPRQGGRALVGVFADTGPKGARLGNTLLTFVSGVGYPDFAVFTSKILEDRDAGVLAAGWFDHAWR